MRTSLTLAGLLASASMAAPVLAQGPLDGPVMTQQGLVQGTDGKQDGVKVFKGIPFAAPPVGDLRWKMPQPAESWDGVRDAGAYGSPCIQPKAPGRVPSNPATDMPDSPEMSEDCLTLNIWTGAQDPGEKRPVMVWLYGGAYAEGGGNAPFSEGDNLAAKGAVVVTFNYRVGAFGFFAHPELTAESEHGASGNQALGDAIAALKWVKANIAAFGGDPDRVTIFGESAGAAMNAGLVGAPPAAGTFDRAISQSGAWMGLGIAPMVPRAGAEAMAVGAAEKAGASSLAELRALPAEDVAKMRGQGMIVDGWIIPEDLTITFEEGRQNKVDVLAGSNGDEGSFTAGFGPPTTLESWNAGAAQRWGSLADLGKTAYPASSDEEAQAVAVQPFSDAMSWHMRLYAEKQAALEGVQSWHYWFTHKPLYDEGVFDMGAAHTGEIPYVFDNLAAPRTFPGNSSVKLMAGNPEQEAMADQVSDYWINFAATGNPNGEGLPEWPSVAELAAGETMVLDGKAGSGRADWLSEDQIKLYEETYKRDVLGPIMGGTKGEAE